MAQIICRNLPPIFAQRVRQVIYPYRIASKDNHVFTVRSQTGSLFRNNTCETSAYPFSVHGYLVWRNWAIAQCIVSEGDTIIEIGANIGTETIGFVDMVGPRGKVYAFEPNPECVRSIKKQIELNRFHNLEVLEVAVGDVEQEVHFVSGPRNQSAVGKISLDGVDQDSMIVDCRKLDSYIGIIDKSTLVVIDVEGSEVNVLKGAIDYIHRYCPVILIEAKEKHLKRYGYSLQELYDQIMQHEYQIYALYRFGISSVTHPINRRYDGDWLCIPNSKGSTLWKSVDRSIKKSALFPCIPGLNPIVLDRRQKSLL